MSTQPDEAQTQAAPTRRTAVQEVQTLREELGGYQGAVNRKVEALREDVRKLQAGMAELEPSARAVAEEEDAFADRITGLVNDAMRPIVDKANQTMASLVARVDALDNDGVSVLGPLVGRVEELEKRSPVQPEEGHLDRILARLATVERRLSTIGTVNPATGAIHPDTAPVPLVHGKVLKLMRQVKELGKDRKADSTMGGYAFRSIDAAMDAVGAAMRDVGLTLETEVADREYATATGTNKEGRSLLYTSARIVMRYTFVDPEDGSRHTFEMSGESRDTTDKATSKANSMALKYGLLQALMIPVQGLPDGDAEGFQVQQGTPAAEQAQRAERPRPPADQPPPTVDKAARAKAAYDALNGIGRVPADRQYAELVRIQNKITAEGLAGFEVEGATLQAHAIAVSHTLARPASGGGEDF